VLHINHIVGPSEAQWEKQAAQHDRTTTSCTRGSSKKRHVHETTSSPFETIGLKYLQFQRRFVVNGIPESLETGSLIFLNLMNTPSSLRHHMDDLFHRLAGQILMVISPNCLGTNPPQ